MLFFDTSFILDFQDISCLGVIQWHVFCKLAHKKREQRLKNDLQNTMGGSAGCWIAGQVQIAGSSWVSSLHIVAWYWSIFGGLKVVVMVQPPLNLRNDMFMLTTLTLITQANFSNYFSLYLPGVCLSWRSIELPTCHTGKNLAAHVYDILHEFDIHAKLFCMTSDSASNNGTMTEELSKFLRKCDLIKWNGPTHHVRCLIHVVNLAVKAFLTILKVAPLSEEHQWMSTREMVEDNNDDDGGLIDEKDDEDDDGWPLWKRLWRRHLWRLWQR